jgi:hypothetical protein
MTLGRMAQQEEKNWVTPTTIQIQRQDMQKRIDYRASIGRKYVPGSLEEQMQHHGRADQANSNTPGNHQGLSVENWPTPTMQDGKQGGITPSQMVEGAGHTGLLHIAAIKQEQWRTPSVAEEKNQNTSKQIYLQNQVGATQKQWATPSAFDWNTGENTQAWEKRAEKQKEIGVNLQRPLKSQILHEKEKWMGTLNPNSSKLNSQWVTQLMGLNLGWVSPSCPASVILNWPKFVSGWLKATTAQTNYDPAEMELFQQQQSERSES